jgi:hypothetical protein
MKFGRMLLGVSILLLGGMVVADEAQPQELQPIVPEDPKLGRPIEFEQDVFPILENNCVACHNLALKEKGLNLEDIENVMKGGKSGPSVIAGEPDKSPLYQLASHSKGPIMPPADNKVEAANLTPQELGILRQWIIEGAKGGDSEGGTEVMWQPPSPNSQAIYALAVTADGQNVAAGRSNQIFLYDLPTGQLAAQLVDPELAALKNGEQPFYKLPPAHRISFIRWRSAPTVRSWLREITAKSNCGSARSVLPDCNSPPVKKPTAPSVPTANGSPPEPRTTR